MAFKLEDGIPYWELKLNQYQRDNLVSFIKAAGFCGEPIEPFPIMNSGDWIGELYWMLDYPEEGVPQFTAEGQPVPKPTDAEREFIRRLKGEPQSLQANKSNEDIKREVKQW